MSSDRIADPWGARTPHEAGVGWPVRVDQYLAEGVAEQDVDRWVQSACVLCSNGCGLDIAVRDGRMVGVRGRAADRVNQGRLGPKGLFGWQANLSPDRLTRPLVRRDGELVPADWDTAMGLLVERSTELLASDGGGAIGVYTAASYSSRSTTPSASWPRPAWAPPTWTATPGCARPPRRPR